MLREKLEVEEGWLTLRSRMRGVDFVFGHSGHCINIFRLEVGVRSQCMSHMHFVHKALP